MVNVLQFTTATAQGAYYPFVFPPNDKALIPELVRAMDNHHSVNIHFTDDGKSPFAINRITVEAYLTWQEMYPGYVAGGGAAQ